MKKNSHSYNLKVLEAAEKGDVYCLEVALIRGGVPYATKVITNSEIDSLQDIHTFHGRGICMQWTLC